MNIWSDPRIGGVSLQHLVRRTISGLRTDGLRPTTRRVVNFTLQRTPLGRFTTRPTALNPNPATVNRWYRAHGRRCTVVIPSYNDFAVLAKCVRSVRRTTRSSNVDIVIVDDCSSPHHRRRLATLARDNVRIIYRDENGGFAKAVNSGIGAARGGDVVLLNSDVVAKAGWLAALQYGAYEWDARVGIVGAKLLYRNGTIQYGGSFRNLDAPDWFDHLYRFRPARYGPANVPQYMIGITGACMYIKREVIDSVGIMDERFPMAFEDIDYSLRAWIAGFRCLYMPTATLIHLESVTRGKVQGRRELDSQAHFWAKWGSWFDERTVRNHEGRIRVIYSLESTNVSGGARDVFEHLNRLADRGFDVELYALEEAPDWFPLRVPVKRFDTYEEMVDDLEQQEAIKVATWWKTAEPVWLASVCRGIPAYFVQDLETSYCRDDVGMQQLVLSSYKPEFHYFTISGWNQEQLLALGHASTLVGIGVDSETFHALPDLTRESDVLLALGRTHYLKNFAMTFRGWHAIPESRRPRLWLYGVEPDIAKDEAKVTYFVRPTDVEINELLNRATVFAQTSLHEGFCLTVLEAMAAGLPVITTDSDGNRDFCKDGVNCLMIDQNDVGQMRDALERLFGDKALREHLRNGGFETAAEYSWSVVIDRIDAFFRSIAPGPDKTT